MAMLAFIFNVRTVLAYEGPSLMLVIATISLQPNKRHSVLPQPRGIPATEFIRQNLQLNNVTMLRLVYVACQ